MHSVDEVRFDLRLGADGAVTVHCTSSVLPEEWADTIPAAGLQQIQILKERLGGHRITEAELVRLGLLLGRALVPLSVAEPLARHISKGRNRLLRMRVVPHDAELAALPWEYVRLQSRYDDLGTAPLALDGRVSLVRSPASGAPGLSPTVRSSSELRVLHASATDVEGFAPLRGDDHAIDLALWGGHARRTRRVVVDRLADPASRATLEEALAAAPDLLVFTGHHTVEGGRPALILADSQGRPDPISGAELAAMLLRAGTPLAVLNACDTASAGTSSVPLTELLVSSGVQTAVGMQMPISDSNAGHFAVGVIGALGDGRSVDEAVAEGRRRVADRAGYAEWGIPTLVTTSRGSEPRAATEERLVRVAPTEADAALVTRGTTALAPSHEAAPGSPIGSTEPAGGAGPAPRRLPKRLVGIGATALAAIVAVVVVLLGSSGADDRAALDISSPSTSTEAPATAATPSTLPFPEDGVIGARMLAGSSLSDTSPSLLEKVEEFERANPVPWLQPEHRRETIDARRLNWPGTPSNGAFASSNGLTNSHCRRVQLSSVNLVGAAGYTWFDGSSHGGMVNAVQFATAKEAQQYYWASTLFLGLRPGQCRGWPEGAVAVDPERLEIERMDFPINGPADDLMTSAGVEGTPLHEQGVRSAYHALFRVDDTVVLANIGSTERLDADLAESALQQVVEIFGRG